MNHGENCFEHEQVQNVDFHYVGATNQVVENQMYFDFHVLLNNYIYAIVWSY